LPEPLRDWLPILSDITIDRTPNTDRNILLEDDVYADGEGCDNISYPRLISSSGPTPRLKLIILGFTETEKEVQPAKAKCTVSHSDGHQWVYPKLQGSGPLFMLPRIAEGMSVRVSLAFEKANEPIIGMKVLVMDEYQRQFSKSLRHDDAM